MIVLPHLPQQHFYGLIQTSFTGFFLFRLIDGHNIILAVCVRHHIKQFGQFIGLEQFLKIGRCLYFHFRWLGKSDGLACHINLNSLLYEINQYFFLYLSTILKVHTLGMHIAFTER